MVQLWPNNWTFLCCSFSNRNNEKLYPPHQLYWGPNGSLYDSRQFTVQKLLYGKSSGRRAFIVCNWISFCIRLCYFSCIWLVFPKFLQSQGNSVLFNSLSCLASWGSRNVPEYFLMDKIEDYSGYHRFSDHYPSEVSNSQNKCYS